ncbi:putative METHIONYL-TRNA SYNTHETASE, mitochondrial [Schizothecium vesticola]|uniref:Probable methionine--tRNA ligase, mitochondrial n=1 Tax=Schizothecium vesticola TaxID=314040 RepID=A0AA40F6F3_9PEZI|nr:putative METHIONYL-TRNA SYNTHETASE, mitochondrial [Schizothecium vesticola]
MEVIRASAARRALKWPSTLASSRNWVCRSCRSHVPTLRRFATTPLQCTSSKPYYVTTPIFYVNAAPHVGHLYTMVLTDVLKRWQTLAGRRALLVTGTDEHGMKIQRAAALSDVAPKEFCDENSAKFETLAEKAQIDFDRFIRTTDPDHAQAVEHFWFLLREKGLIYESKHEGWYCVSDECFYPESLVDKKQDPFTGEVFMASTESGNKVEWTEEKTYHFRMTELRDQLLEFYEQNPGWVTPASQMKQVVDWVKNSLEDLSVSRPVDRLSWGIRVPDDPSQTIYVWVDALVNYLTMASFPVWPPGEESKGGWPADVHVIGKDILRFHCVYWPALLLAVGIPLPKKVLSHAHWTMNRAKMSKSVGNVVNPFYAIDRWGVDLVRFYLVHDGGIVDDADYNNEIIVERYKKLLQSGLGNLTSRITRPNLWSVRDSVVAAGNERSPTSKTVIEDALASHLELLEGLAAAVSGHMERLNPSAALRQVMDAVDKTNKFLSITAPWALVKRPEDEESKELVNPTIYLASESLRLVGILLQPFIPDMAAHLLDIMGVAADKRQLSDARPRSDVNYGEPIRSPGKDLWDSLAPPLPLEE